MPQTLLMLLVYLSIDPFADATKGDDRLPGGTDEYIHIRISTAERAEDSDHGPGHSRWL